MFYDKSCNIYSVDYNKVGGVAKRVKTILYSSIPCNFEQSKTYMKQLDISKNIDLPKYEVVINITCNQVRENQVIELIDPTIGSLGEYIISGVNAMKSVGGGIDCITLQVSELKGG